MRESGLGATAHVPDEPITWEGWEDSAVPPERLGDYLRELRALFDNTATAATSTATSARAACTRASISTSRPRAGIDKFRAFLDEAADLVVEPTAARSRASTATASRRPVLLPIMFGAGAGARLPRRSRRIWDPDGR